MLRQRAILRCSKQPRLQELGGMSQRRQVPRALRALSQAATYVDGGHARARRKPLRTLKANLYVHTTPQIVQPMATSHRHLLHHEALSQLWDDALVGG